MWKLYVKYYMSGAHSCFLFHFLLTHNFDISLCAMRLTDRDSEAVLKVWHRKVRNGLAVCIIILCSNLWQEVVSLSSGPAQARAFLFHLQDAEVSDCAVLYSDFHMCSHVKPLVYIFIFLICVYKMNILLFSPHIQICSWSVFFSFLIGNAAECRC